MQVENFPLLRTKLHRPGLAPGHIPRPQLIELLNHNPQRKLTLVSAPAGFGKTTLMAEWLLGSPAAVAWLSLDEGDADFPRFFRYVIAALQSIWPELGLELLSLLQAPQLPPVDYLAAGLINDLADRPEPFILVLDDLHRVDSRPVNQFLEMLLDYFPHQGQLVFITRIDPPLPLARLRARNQMVEIRATELRLNPAEIDAFLKQARLEVQPGAAVVAALAERTEGWVVGVQLASLSMYHHADPAAFVEQFTGTDRYVMEYLVDEVLTRQSSHVRAFLLRTAILDQFCTALAEALLAVTLEAAAFPDDAQPDENKATPAADDILETIRQANLFLIPLDSEANWYRYHHLFQSLLQHRLHGRYGDEQVAVLHAAAGHWLADHGLVEEAINHHLAAGDAPAAARLIEQHRHTLASQGDWPTLDRWLGWLSDDITRQRPGLVLTQTWLAFMRGQSFNMIEARLKEAEAGLTGSARPETEAEQQALAGEIDTLWSRVYYFRNEPETAITCAQQALDRLPEPMAYLRATAINSLALSERLVGQAAQSIDRLKQALDMADLPSMNIAGRLLQSLIAIYLSQGALRPAAQTAHSMLKMATANKVVFWQQWAKMYLGAINYEWHELGTAADYLAQVVSNNYYTFGIQYRDAGFCLALTYQAQGRPDRANQVLERLQDSIFATSNTQFLTQLTSFQAHLLFAQGQLDEAMTLSDAVELNVENEAFMLIESSGRTRAKLLLAKGTTASLEAADRLVAQLLQAVEQQHNLWRKAEVLALQALVLDGQGRRAPALGVLEEALTVAQPGGLIRTFVDLGPNLIPLLQALAAQSSAPAYIDQILAAYPVAAPSSSEPSPQSDSLPSAELLDPLTDRELEILALLVQRYSNKEIAAELFISPLTVKKHTANIYQKLQVKSRWQAAARAKALNLINNGH